MNPEEQPNIPLIAEDEEFKPIKINGNFCSYYLISNHGRLYSTKTNKILTNILSGHPYYRVNMHVDGKSITKDIHRMVAEAFVYNPNPEKYIYVNHILEFEKTNNYYKNLIWVTPKENTNWGTCNARRAKKYCKPVNQYDLCGNLLNTYKSIKEAQEKTGYNYTRLVQHISSGKPYYKCLWTH